MYNRITVGNKVTGVLQDTNGGLSQAMAVMHISQVPFKPSEVLRAIEVEVGKGWIVEGPGFDIKY